MCIKTIGKIRPKFVGRKGEKSRRYRPWVVAPISMAATQGNLRGRRPPFPVNGGPVPVSPRCVPEAARGRR